MESTIDLKALLVEREDCDAGTVQQLRNALAQGGTQYRSLRDVADLLKKKLESATGAAAKRWHLKLGIAQFFLGYMVEAIDNLRQAEGALANFYLGRALASRQEYDDALKAFDRAEKAGYTTSQVNLQRVGIYRQKGDLPQARNVLTKLDAPLQIMVFDQEPNFPRYQDKLKEYEYVSKQIKTEYVDADKKPSSTGDKQA